MPRPKHDRSGYPISEGLKDGDERASRVIGKKAKAEKATAEEYNAAELRVFREKWAKLPPGKHAWPSVTKAEVLAELAKKGGRRHTRRGRGSRYTRRR